MIVLDTNVISEPLKKNGDPRVREWLNAHLPESLYTTAINLAELYAGISGLPDGKRKRGLDTLLRTSLGRLFGTRILNFDVAAAESYAMIAEESKRSGRTVPHDDGIIAAIARAHGFALATRNVSNFKGAGIDLINPWKN